jgi:molybdopterin-binding protein
MEGNSFLPRGSRSGLGSVKWSFLRKAAMKYGARNQLAGEVVEIRRGTLMCQVKVRIPAASTVCSVMTLESLDDLGIKEGSKVKAVAKAVNVLLTTE